MNRLLCSLALAATSCFAATPLFRASFGISEKSWSAVRGTATPDAAVLHDGKQSLRLEAGGSPDVCVQFAPVTLTIGKRYELTGWTRTDHLAIRDLDRSPIAIGAALTMASMPFDVHSASIGGTTAWTRLSLQFVASRASDRILLTAGNGGAVQGKAWFEGISLDEISDHDEWPIREAVQTFGPAYRYPTAGWIYLHIEGKPYERGYQHGHLMAREIPEYLARCADDLGGEKGWSQYRLMADSLFLRGFDREILEEMRGIADGAADAGAKWQGHRVDLVDIVVANVTVEMGELRGAMRVTPTGLEGLTFDKPHYGDRTPDKPTEHCSAFAATGAATRDGKMIIGHVTWWPLTLAEQTNVMLDIQPEKGHRMLLQSYPGGIESGTDWYQNDAGMVLTETTIQQTPFNAQGTPVAFRARMAIQYGGNVDEVVAQLGSRNNGLYTNEWLIGDAKNNEIAMYELGTAHTRLWRSSKNEWFGGTPGFYWGNNNAKDLSINLEYHPDPQGPPVYVPYVPAVRDLAWQDLYRKYQGRIDEQFAFLAFRSAPLVSHSTMDAKVATADLASRLMVWGEIGRPNQREWLPQPGDFAKNDGLYPSGYHLFRAEPNDTVRAALQSAPVDTASDQRSATGRSYARRFWKGWVLPASDADTWFVRGAEKYYNVLRSGDFENSLEALRASYRRLKLQPEDPATQVALVGVQGALFLDSLRRQLGDDRFFQLMSDFFSANTTKTVTAQSFLNLAGTSFTPPDAGKGAVYVASDIEQRLSSAVLVYGTLRDAGANRYAAECLQREFLDRYESQIPIYKDFEAGDEVLLHHDVIFVGRPESNSALAALKLAADFNGASFRIAGGLHVSEREALLLAAQNPLDPAHMLLVLAGNDALRTVKLARAVRDIKEPAEYNVLNDAQKESSGFVP